MPDNTSHAVAVRAAQPLAMGGDILSNPAVFEHTWRVAKAFAASSLVPKHLQGRPENCLVALDMARLLGENPLVVCQNIYFVSDRPGWGAQYIISRLNRSGLIRGRVQWRSEGKGAELAVTAWAIDVGSGEEIAETVSLKMAEAEGWTRNPKYKSLPDLMLKYRSATFLARLHFPEIMFGLPTSEELDDMKFAGTLRPDASGVYAPERPRRADFADLAEQRFQAAVESGEFTGDVASEVAAETVDPETGEVTEAGAAEPVVDNSAENSGSVAEGASQPSDDEFWSRESYEIAPRKKGNTYQWREWEAEMLGRARTLPGLMAGGKLRAHAVKWLKASAQWNPGHSAFVAEFDRLTVPVVEGEG